MESKKGNNIPLILENILFFVIILYKTCDMVYSKATLDKDNLWHYLMGRDIAMTGRISTENMYSWIEGTKWNQQEWLFDVFLYNLVKTFGTAGYILLYALTIITVIYLGYRFSKTRIRAKWMYIVYSILVLTHFSTNRANRPAYFSTLLLPCLLILFDKPEKGLKMTAGKAALFLSAGIFVSNFHCGQGIMILAFLGLKFIADVAYIKIYEADKQERVSSYIRVKALYPIMFLIGLCINVCGTSQLSNMLCTMNMASTSQISEWMPAKVKFYREAIMRILIAISFGHAIGIFLRKKKERVNELETVEGLNIPVYTHSMQKTFTDTVLICAAYILATKSVKANIILIYMLIMIWYPYFEEMVMDFVSSVKNGRRYFPEFRVAKPVFAAGVIAGILAAIIMKTGGDNSFEAYVKLEQDKVYDEEIIDYLKDNPSRLIHGYSNSNLLMWNGIKVCMDTRQQPYVKENGYTQILDDIFSLITRVPAKEKVKEIIDKYNAEAVLCSKDLPLSWYFEQDPDFTLAIEDTKGNQIWIRKDR